MCVCVKKSERAITEQSHNSKEEIVNLFCLRFFLKKKTTCTNTKQALSTFRKKNIQRTYTCIKKVSYRN